MRNIRQPIILAMAIGVAAFSSSSWSQAFPSKPVTIRVAYPAGGPADVVVRQATAKIQASLGQSVVVDNLAGAGGTVATLNAVKASADGYQLLGQTNDLILAPLAMAAAQYKAEQFRLVAPLAIGDLLLVARPTISARTISELVEYSKSLPNGLSVSNTGVGSTFHLAAEELMAVTGLKGTGVPYKGTAPILQDLIGGHVDIGFVAVGPNTIAMVQQKKLIALGIAGTKRNPALPDVPTLSELHPARPILHALWVGLLVPRATPEPVVQRLREAVTEAVRSPEYQKFAAEIGVRVLTLSSKETDDFYSTEIRKYGELAKRVNLVPQ
jgi:tripartite-type tricarboxylate transporter receptor subunit TctC